MPMRKRTLRQLPPEARKLAKLVGELESVATRLKNLVPAIQTLEMLARAEQRRRAAEDFGTEPRGLFNEQDN